MSSIVNYTRETAYNLVVGCPKAIGYSLQDTGKTIVGVAASALSIATLGKIDSINEYAKDYTWPSIHILPRLHEQVIKVLNPDSHLEKPDLETFLTQKIARPILRHYGSFMNDSNNFITRHLFSRIILAFGTVVDLVTRVADLALGLVAATFSVVCLGRVGKINQFANSQLAALGIINDVCMLLRWMINPYQSFMG